MKKLLAILLLLPSLAIAQYNAKTGRVQSGSSAGQVPIWSGTAWIPGDPFVQGVVAHDADASTINPVLAGFYASATAPADVSADNYSVRGWALRNGAQVFNLSTAGTLYDARQIRSLTSGTDSVTVTDGSGALNVIVDSGTLTAVTSVTNPVTVAQATAANLLATANIRDGAGNALTSNSSTYTAKFALDANILGTLGTAFSTAGKVDVKAADGDVLVRSNAASTFPVNLGTWIGSAAPTVGQKAMTSSLPMVLASDQTSIPVAATLSSETTKVIGTVRNLGNAGGIFDTTQNATVPANALSMGCNFTAAPATVTTGNQGAVQCNSKGELLTQITDGTTNVAVIAGTTALKTDLSSVAGTATAVGSGTATGALRVELANNGTGVMTSIGSITSSVVPGTGATNLGKAEDAASGSGDTGVLGLMVRKDTNATLTDADGDYVAAAADNYGVQSVSQRHPNAIRCTITSTATSSTLVTGCSAPGANLSIYVTAINWSSSIISTTANFMRLQSGTGGTCGSATTVLYDGYAQVAFSNQSWTLGTPWKLTANHELCFVHASAGTRLVNITGFIAP